MSKSEYTKTYQLPLIIPTVYSEQHQLTCCSLFLTQNSGISQDNLMFYMIYNCPNFVYFRYVSTSCVARCGFGAGVKKSMGRLDAVTVAAVAVRGMEN